MGTVENLIAAKALIDTPEKWGKGSGHIPPREGFCAMGACGEVSTSYALQEALMDARPARFQYLPVHEYNDHPDTTHADIMALFDRAIAAEKAKETSNA